MRRLFLFCLLTCLGLPLSSRGQLSVRLQPERDTLLLYESVPVMVSIRNFSGRPIQLEDHEEAPWLNFLVTDEDGSVISEVGRLRGGLPVIIPAGQTISQRINLLPLYDLRQRGTYRVQAFVDSSGNKFASAPAKFSIVVGREIWSQMCGLPPSEDGRDEYRTYSLVSRRSNQHDVLYVGVRDDGEGMVYGMLPLGNHLPMGQPETRVDTDGRLHVLFRSGPRSFDYALVDPNAKILSQAVYSDFMSKPALVADPAGKVVVHGGEQVYPKIDRVVSEEQVQSPPAKAAKKKSSPLIGRKKTPPQSINTNLPSANSWSR